MVFQHDDIIDIDVDIFTLLATVWCPSKGTRSMPLCLGSIQFPQLAAKEHHNGSQNDVDDDDTGATAMTNATIAVDHIAATTAVSTMMMWTHLQRWV